MIRVVSGSAMISPIKPRSAPHTDSDSKRMAGLSPMVLPMMRGVTIASVIICTTQNKPTAIPNTIQKFCPVSAALSIARKAVGIRAKVWRYGTRSMMPMRMPKPIAIGKSMMEKPIQNMMPMQRATRPWPRIYLFSSHSTSFISSRQKGRFFSGNMRIQLAVRYS